jgi:hypothetical protein
VPAAAVIPAPIAYIQVVAVKKRVVEFWRWLCGLDSRSTLQDWGFPSRELVCN